MNTQVSFKLAKLLKEKGVDIDSDYWYSIEFNCYHQDDFDNCRGYIPPFLCYAPTIVDVVMWLYEKHGIWISVEPPFPRRILLWEYYIQNANDRTLLGQNNGYENPTEAYEAAIRYTLENLIK